MKVNMSKTISCKNTITWQSIVLHISVVYTLQWQDTPLKLLTKNSSDKLTR